MGFRILYTRPDGGLSVVVPSASWAGTPQELVLKDVPGDAVDVEIVDESVIPTDRTFRGAWVKAPGAVGVDMPKARGIVSARTLRARDAELDVLRQDLAIAEAGNDTASAAQIRARINQIARAQNDATIAAAQTPAALKAVRPAGLDWTKF